MVKREIVKEIRERADYFPILALVGPHGVGKTALAKELFKQHVYVNLQDYAVRQQVLDDPYGFIEKRSAEGVVLDGIMYAPVLLPYLAKIAATRRKPGHIVLIAATNLLKHALVAKHLAGSVGMVTLLPPSIAEHADKQQAVQDVDELVLQGLLPVPAGAPAGMPDYPSYIARFLEHDVMLFSGISDITLFRKFMVLCAGSVGKILNLTALANQCGVSVPTVKSWVGILEKGYIVFLLPPHYEGFGKRVVKTPKLYFYDTALACHLLGVRDLLQLQSHFAYQALVESFIIADMMKWYYNRGEQPPLYFWRDKTGREVSCLVDKGYDMVPVAVCPVKTLHKNVFAGVQYWNELAKHDQAQQMVVYAGEQEGSAGAVLSWRHIAKLFDK